MPSGQRKTIASLPFDPMSTTMNATGSCILVQGRGEEIALLVEGQVVPLEAGKESRAMAVSEDGSTVALAFQEQARVYRTSDGHSLCEVAHGDRSSRIGSDIWSLCLSKNGDRLLTGAADSTGRMWSVATGSQLLVLDLSLIHI